MKDWMVLLLLLYTTEYTDARKRNNVCKTFGDYYFQDFSSNCWYNPDVTASAPDLIISHGYPVEIYETVTQDFYILKIFRIPPRSNNIKGTVFLQHPLAASCTVWIDLGNQSLAFLLSDAGYDVWLGNFRGNIYSDKHVYLSSHSNAYWNYSFHEFGYYDLPAQIEIVKKQSIHKEKFYYIGHSVATTAAYVYSSMRPQHAKNNIKIFISLAPVASLRYMTSPVIHLAPFANILLKLATLFHMLNIIPHNGVVHLAIKLVCIKIPSTMKLCADIIQLLGGIDREHFDPSLFPIMVYQNFAGFSGNVIFHLGQIYKSKGRFQMYDYGTHRNKNYYHSKQPPLYPIEDIQVPMFFMYGGHDTVADEKDVLDFYYKLPSEVRYNISKVEPYTHTDFVYAKKIVDLVYKPIMEVIEKMAPENTTDDQ